MKAIFKTAAPYQKDKMNLPVENVAAAIPFYERVMGFQVVSQKDSPCKSVVLGRDGIQTQDGCFFEVDNAEAAFAELQSHGLKKEKADFRLDRYGDTSYKVFFVIAPDGLCYCLGERQN